MSDDRRRQAKRRQSLKSNELDNQRDTGMFDKRNRVLMWAVLVAAALVYTLTYLHHPALPGNSQRYPEGWWGWFDQGQYLRAATAFLHGDLAPQNFFYPPLYPLIGAAFLPLAPNHPFFVFDGVAFLFFVYTFVRFAETYISRLEAVLIVVATLFLNYRILEQYAIPWTTACTIAIYSFTLLALVRLNEATRDAQLTARPYSVFHALPFAAVFGLLVLSRPVDAGLAAVFFPAYLYFDWKRTNSQPLRGYWTRLLAVGSLLTLGFASGLALFAIYNEMIFGSPLGGYVQSTASASGYFVSELPRKVFTLLVDTYTVFLEPGASLVTHYPWILLSVFGIALALLSGDALKRVVAIALIAHFCLYAPYGDLLPNGLWRFDNIHYFKWMWPYLGFYTWLTVRWAVATWRNDRRRFGKRLAIVAGSVFLMLTPRFAVVERMGSDRVVTTPSGETSIEINLPADLSQLDFVDLPRLHGGFTEIYFGEHRANLDGRDLAKVRDFRLVPSPTGARLIFIRPVAGHRLVFRPGQGVDISDVGSTVPVGRYHFSISWPHLRHDVPR